MRYLLICGDDSRWDFWGFYYLGNHNFNEALTAFRMPIEEAAIAVAAIVGIVALALLLEHFIPEE